MDNVQRNLYFINILLLLLILNFFLSNLACQIFETMRKIAYFSKKKKNIRQRNGIFWWRAMSADVRPRGIEQKKHELLPL